MPHADTDMVQAYHPDLDRTINVNFGALASLNGWELQTPAPEDVSGLKGPGRHGNRGRRGRRRKAADVVAHAEAHPEQAPELLAAEKDHGKPRKSVVKALENLGGNA